jgi:hypothetical protein
MLIYIVFIIFFYCFISFFLLTFLREKCDFPFPKPLTSEMMQRIGIATNILLKNTISNHNELLNKFICAIMMHINSINELERQEAIRQFATCNK